ncbi:MAG TPA: Mur ligase family protein [Candidatus Saccharimonadales bacterium]|nr:Mur ligase family protein [Candidatus Saccharimonadales bacterium]
MNIKKFGKAVLARRLERQVRRLRRQNNFKVIAVAGSVGKTSTKLAIAKTLGAGLKVRYQDGNYNDRLTVPLIFFGQTEPGIYDVLGWRKLLKENRRALRQKYPYDVVVVELGTDAPGQLEQFAYLRPDITVITAVADEHMEYFKSLEAVAREELTPLKFSKQALLNTDDIAPEYVPAGHYQSYGLLGGEYRLSRRQPVALQGQKLTFRLPSGAEITEEVAVLGDQGAKIALAAVAVQDMLGRPPAQIKKSLKAITHVPGRMQILAGKRGSIIIDDTYNASPVAVEAALDVLYATAAPQRIAILGSMNELGEDSATLHSEIGGYCNPKQLDLVVTIGREANDNLAPVAQNQGCRVETFTSPYEAGRFVATKLKPGGVVLAKGSQNGVFAEEAVKQLLANQSQARKLVRQTPYWLGVKRRQFPDA